MKKEILKIDSVFDGLPLSVAVYAPDEACTVKGIVQMVHGMSEHKERYAPFMEFLAEAGYASILHDHRGHGASILEPGDLGYMYDKTGKGIVEDVHQLTLYMKERFPGVPVYLFGHSMGSIIARVYLRKYDGEIDKVILCGTPNKNPAVGLAKLLIKLLTAVKGERHVSKVMFNLSLGGFNKTIPNPRTECDWISVNEANVDEYLACPLCGFGFTLNGYQNLMLLMEACFAEDGWGMTNPDLPIFFIAGSEDPCIGGKDGWMDSRNFLRKRGYTSVEGKLYEGCRHEILQEEIAEDVFRDVLAFIQKQK